MAGMRYGSAPERRERLFSHVTQQGFSSTSELMAALGVSDMTVRRDAQLLAEDGRVRIVHGGVSVLPPSELLGNGAYEERASRASSLKKSIGREAASSVHSGQVIAIDAGTTAREVARALQDEPITAITHSALVLADLLARDQISVVALGGQLHRDTLSFEGPQVLAAVRELQVDVFFLAASGVSSRGVYCANDFDAVAKRALIGIAERVVLVVDSSKFQTAAMVRICDLADVDEVIVDEQLSDSDRMVLEQAGVAIRLVRGP